MKVERRNNTPPPGFTIKQLVRSRTYIHTGQPKDKVYLAVEDLCSGSLGVVNLETGYLSLESKTTWHTDGQFQPVEMKAVENN